MSTDSVLRTMIADAASFLYRESVIDESMRVSWEEQDVRGTAYAVLALERLGEPVNSLLMDGAVRWLRDQLAREHHADGHVGKSWEAQVWDTSLGLAVVKRLREKTLRSVEKWLHFTRGLNMRYENWHDEVWETCFAAMALLERPVSEDRAWVPGCLKWLWSQRREHKPTVISIQGNYHYTALYLRLMAMVRRSLTEQEIASLEDTPADPPPGCIQFLVEPLWNKEGHVWTGEVFSNAYCLLALVETDSLPEGYEDKCIEWFLRHRVSHGGFGSIEETALVTEALLSLDAARQKRELQALIRAGNEASVIEDAVRKPIVLDRMPLRKEFVVAPPRLLTIRPKGDVVLYFSKRNLRRITLFTTITAGALGLIATLLTIIDLWPT